MKQRQTTWKVDEDGIWLKREMCIKCISRCTWHRKVQRGILLSVFICSKEEDKHTLKRRYTRWLKTHFKLINDFPLTLSLSLTLIASFSSFELHFWFLCCMWKGSITGKNENKNFSLMCFSIWTVSEHSYNERVMLGTC